MKGSTNWGSVTVLWARTTSAERSVARGIEALGPTQVARYRALEGRSAVRFALSRALIVEAIRTIAGHGADLEISTTCERCGGEHGPVRHVAGQVALSVSYAGDLVVVAGAAAAAVEGIGVDVEGDDDDEQRRAAELGPLFAPEPAPTIMEWTRIEAVLKADGRALRVSPSAVTFSPRRGTAVVPGRGEPLDVATVAGPAGHVLSVAVVPIGAETSAAPESPRRSTWSAPAAAGRRTTRAAARPQASR